MGEMPARRKGTRSKKDVTMEVTVTADESAKSAVSDDSSFHPVHKKKVSMVDMFIDTAKKIKSGSTLTKLFVDKLVKVYDEAAFSKKTEFTLAMKRLLYQTLVIVAQINEGVKTSIVRNVECERILNFIVELMPRPPSMALCLEYNPKDSHVILGGLHSGQVCIWDVRKNSTHPNEVTRLDVSHTDPCHSALWIQ